MYIINYLVYFHLQKMYVLYRLYINDTKLSSKKSYADIKILI